MSEKIKSKVSFYDFYNMVLSAKRKILSESPEIAPERLYELIFKTVSRDLGFDTIEGYPVYRYGDSDLDYSCSDYDFGSKFDIDYVDELYRQYLPFSGFDISYWFDYQRNADEDAELFSEEELKYIPEILDNGFTLVQLNLLKLDPTLSDSELFTLTEKVLSSDADESDDERNMKYEVIKKIINIERGRINSSSIVSPEQSRISADELISDIKQSFATLKRAGVILDQS